MIQHCIKTIGTLQKHDDNNYGNDNATKQRA